MREADNVLAAEVPAIEHLLFNYYITALPCARKCAIKCD